MRIVLYLSNQSKSELFSSYFANILHVIHEALRILEIEVPLLSIYRLNRCVCATKDMLKQAKTEYQPCFHDEKILQTSVIDIVKCIMD